MKPFLLVAMYLLAFGALHAASEEEVNLIFTAYLRFDDVLSKHLPKGDQELRETVRLFLRKREVRVEYQRTCLAALSQAERKSIRLRYDVSDLGFEIMLPKGIVSHGWRTDIDRAAEDLRHYLQDHPQAESGMAKLINSDAVQSELAPIRREFLALQKRLIPDFPDDYPDN